MNKEKKFIPLGFSKLEDTQILENSRHFYKKMTKRRSIRDFSTKSVPKEIIENVIKTASTAPSGAHKQPWTFCAVSNKEIKKAIREAAEAEEKISYGGRMSEKVGIGIGIFQQNFGIFKNFGVLVNYGYQVQLSDNNALTFGFNFLYASSGIDRSKIVISNPDPFLINFQERPIINFQPAINLTLGSFDVGIFLENLVDYDLKAYDFITEFSKKTFSGHLMYTKPLKNTTGALKDGKLQLMTIAKKQGKKEVKFTGSLLFDLPNLGWAQATYDDFYGTSFGLGVNISEKISIGFVYEKGKNNLGVTNEIGLTYTFGKHNYAEINAKKKMMDENNPDTTLENFEEKKQKEAERTAKIINSYKIRQDSINNLQKKEADRKYSQLLQIIKNNQPNKKTEIVSNKKENPSSIKSIPILKKMQELKQNVSLKGSPKGYYVVANYYSRKTNAEVFANSMNSKGFDAKLFKHPTKSYYYVYLASFDSNNQAQSAVESKLNNTYNKLLSIVNIEDNRLRVVPINQKKKVKTPASKIYKPSKPLVKKEPIKIKKLKSSQGLEPGYYIIANVFSKKYYANKFIETLANQQLNPQFFVYPKNNYRYVYLAKKDTKEEIVELFYSNINGKYEEEKWIMHIE